MKWKMLLIPLLILISSGCSVLKTPVSQTQYVVAADVRNDPVTGISPQIEQAIIQDYLADEKVQRSRSIHWSL